MAILKFPISVFLFVISEFALYKSSKSCVVYAVFIFISIPLSTQIHLHSNNVSLLLCLLYYIF